MTTLTLPPYTKFVIKGLPERKKVIRAPITTPVKTIEQAPVLEKEEIDQAQIEREKAYRGAFDSNRINHGGVHYD